MHRYALLMAVVLPIMVANAAAAQDSIVPKKGTWGVETGDSFGVSVLRFNSPGSAWLLGLSGQYIKRDTDGTLDTELYSVTGQLGHRWYRRTDGRIRPFTSLSALLGKDNQTSGMRYGVSVDFGAAYFWPHVSLGGAMDVAGTMSRGRTNSIGGTTRITTIVLTSGLRLLAAVYF
jgi:hypothetical protein